jgi:hypothetical protein
MADNAPEKAKSILIKTPQSMTMFSATSRSILDELRERHKGVDKGGKRKPHPSELLTLDKLGEALLKFSNLSEQAKSPASVDQALKQLTDIANKGKERYLYLYPYLIKSANKVVAKICLIAPQTSHEVDGMPYRDSCFEYSKSTLDLILSNRSKKVKEIDEASPGLSLFQKNKSGLDWLYPERFSLETEVGLLIKAGFKPYSYLPIREFIDDFIVYGQEKNSIDQIVPGYHVIIDEIQLKEDGSYVRQPEMVIHYRAQADGLERFALMYLPKLADEGAPEYKSKITQYRNLRDSEPPGRKQSREKMKALITLVNEFPFSKLSSELAKNVENTCKESVRILEKLVGNMDNLIGRKYSSIYKNLGSSIVNLVAEHTKTELTLFQLDIEKEVQRAGIKEEEKIKEFTTKLLEEVRKSYPLRESRDESGKKVYYTVDQSYMAGVLHKYSTTASGDSTLEREYELAKLINQDLVQTNNPRLNINIKPELMEKLTLDILRKEHESKERMRSEFLKGKFNPITGFLGLAISLFITLFFYSAENDIVYLLFGIPVSFLIGYLCAVFLKIGKLKRGGRKDSETTSMRAIDSGEDSKEEKLNAIAKAASKFIFPAKYDKITDKVYDNQSLRNKISEHFTEIKTSVPILRKETDVNKVASTIEHSVLNTSVVIAIPQDITPPNKPNSVIISKNDFKAPLYRTQLAEHYRAEAEKNKGDKALVRYYTFLINILEVEYPKFLNKKIR